MCLRYTEYNATRVGSFPSRASSAVLENAPRGNMTHPASASFMIRKINKLLALLTRDQENRLFIQVHSVSMMNGDCRTRHDGTISPCRLDRRYAGESVFAGTCSQKHQLVRTSADSLMPVGGDNHAPYLKYLIGESVCDGDM